jgi:carbonic anhydrase
LPGDALIMTKLFHFDTPRGKYQADAAVVWCFDHRFDLAFAKFLKRQGILTTDVIKVAGGAKCLASPPRESDREFVLDQIRTSIRLHETRLVILMLHSDCGAYGGLDGGFGGDARAEEQHHEAELLRAAAFLQSALPQISVRCYLVDFDGVWAVEAPERASPTQTSQAAQTRR